LNVGPPGLGQQEGGDEETGRQGDWETIASLLSAVFGCLALGRASKLKLELQPDTRRRRLWINSLRIRCRPSRAWGIYGGLLSGP
jgi:hypothetical protein